MKHEKYVATLDSVTVKAPDNIISVQYITSVFLYQFRCSILNVLELTI